MSAIESTTTRTSQVIPAVAYSVHLVIKKTAEISQKLNAHCVRASFLQNLLFVTCVTENSLARNVTPTTYIVAAKTSSISVTLTKNAQAALMSMNFLLDHNRVVIIARLNTCVAGENALPAKS